MLRRRGRRSARAAGVDRVANRTSRAGYSHERDQASLEGDDCRNHEPQSDLCAVRHCPMSVLFDFDELCDSLANEERQRSLGPD